MCDWKDFFDKLFVLVTVNKYMWFHYYVKCEKKNDLGSFTNLTIIMTSLKDDGFGDNHLPTTDYERDDRVRHNICVWRRRHFIAPNWRHLSEVTSKMTPHHVPTVYDVIVTCITNFTVHIIGRYLLCIKKNPHHHESIPGDDVIFEPSIMLSFCGSLLSYTLSKYSYKK